MFQKCNIDPIYQCQLQILWQRFPFSDRHHKKSHTAKVHHDDEKHHVTKHHVLKKFHTGQQHERRRLRLKHRHQLHLKAHKKGLTYTESPLPPREYENYARTFILQTYVSDQFVEMFDLVLGQFPTSVISCNFLYLPCQFCFGGLSHSMEALSLHRSSVT